jgi:ferredoxin
VKEVNANGEVIFDQHALGCSICVDIAQDVITMDKDGKTPKEIRTAIDQTYSQYGPSNMPPVQ